MEAKERKQLEREQRRAARLKADRKAAIEELKKRRGGEKDPAGEASNGGSSE